MKSIKILVIVFFILLICLPIISCDITKVALTSTCSYPMNINLIYSFKKDTTKKFIDSLLIAEKEVIPGYTPKGLPKDFILRSVAILSKSGYIILNASQKNIELPNSKKIDIELIFIDNDKGLNCSSANASIQPDAVFPDTKVIHAIHASDSATEEPNH